MPAEQANAVSSDVAFTSAVKEIQRQRGSRASYARLESRGGWATEIDDDLKGFIAAQRTFFLATSNAENRTVHLFLIDYAYKQRVEITTRRASVRTRSRRRRPR